MKKYHGIILAAAAALMITSCSSVFAGKEPQNTAAGPKEETPVVKIESGTQPVTQTDEKAGTKRHKADGDPEETGEPGDVSSVSQNMYTTARVHVRSGCSADSASLAVMEKGQQIKVTGKSCNGWIGIDLKGREGYVSKTYVSDTKPETELSEKIPAPEKKQGSEKKGKAPPEKQIKKRTNPAPASGAGKAAEGVGGSDKTSETAVTGSDNAGSAPTVEPSPFTSKPADGNGDGPGTVVRPGGKSGGVSPGAQSGPGVQAGSGV